MLTEWRERKEKFERGHIGDDQLLNGTQEYDIFFKGTQVKASSPSHLFCTVVASLLVSVGF
jgi:hypothetical protein